MYFFHIHWARRFKRDYLEAELNMIITFFYLYLSRGSRLSVLALVREHDNVFASRVVVKHRSRKVFGRGVNESVSVSAEIV